MFRQTVGRNKRSALRRLISSKLAEVAVETLPAQSSGATPGWRNALRLLRPTGLPSKCGQDLGCIIAGI